MTSEEESTMGLFSRSAFVGVGFGLCIVKGLVGDSLAASRPQHSLSRPFNLAVKSVFGGGSGGRFKKASFQ
jgi:hypothetical protein